MVSQAVTRQAVAAVSQRCSVTGKRESSSRGGKWNSIEKNRRSAQVADPGDSLAGREPRLALELDDRAGGQLLTRVRHCESDHSASDSDQPVVDEHRDLFGQPFLET